MEGRHILGGRHSFCCVVEVKNVDQEAWIYGDEPVGAKGNCGR